MNRPRYHLVVFGSEKSSVILEVTHCDEMDRAREFKKLFGNVKTYDSPLIK